MTKQAVTKNVIAALDSSPVARPVLDTAVGIARLTGRRVEAVNVADGSTTTPAVLADRSDVPFRSLAPPPVDALLRVLEDPDSSSIVVGARRSAGSRKPVGRTALALVERASKPVIVVPPEAAGRPLTELRRLLVPLEGTELESAVTEAVLQDLVADVELVAVHVFDAANPPRFLDRPARDLELWAHEFLARWCRTPGVRLNWRLGAPGASVADLAHEENADLIVLSWSQNLGPGHADVVRDVLARSRVPVVLLPLSPPQVVDLRDAEQRQAQPGLATARKGRTPTASSITDA